MLFICLKIYIYEDHFTLVTLTSSRCKAKNEKRYLSETIHTSAAAAAAAEDGKLAARKSLEVVGNSAI